MGVEGGRYLAISRAKMLVHVSTHQLMEPPSLNASLNQLES